MAFTGNVPYSMDDKNRVPIPPRFREQFRNVALLTTGLEPCVLLYTEEGFDAASAKVRSIPEETEEGRNARRDFFSNAWTSNVDAQGRVRIEDYLLEHAGIEAKDVVVVAGVGDYMEIWKKTEWDERRSKRSSARVSETAALAANRAAGEGRGA
jgi:MraZ protein